MKGLEINDLLVALMANHIVINDELYATLKEMETAGFHLSDECDETHRRLTATITFSYAAYDPEDMEPQPAPGGTPRNDDAMPKTMRVFVIGQTVRVRDDVDGEASAYSGRTGQVTHLDRSRASGVVRYFTTLSTHDAFYADELEPAEPSRKFDPGDRVCIAVADEPYYQNRKATVQDISIFTCDIKLDAVGAETEEDREVITIEYKRLEPAD